MDLLRGNQRKALKFLYKNYKKDTVTTKVILSKHLNLNYQETSQICKELHAKGFVSFIGVNYDPKITLNGIDYFLTETAYSIETVLKSVIFPIIVSVVTTLLTLLLKE